MTFNFDVVSKANMDLIFKIRDRAVDKCKQLDREMSDEERRELLMDLCAAHASNPLRLEELLNADDANFTHDVFGIRRHMDRDTGKLGGCFSPRFSVRNGTV